MARETYKLVYTRIEEDKETGKKVAHIYAAEEAVPGEKDDKLADLSGYKLVYSKKEDNVQRLYGSKENIPTNDSDEYVWIKIDENGLVVIQRAEE